LLKILVSLFIVFKLTKLIDKVIILRFIPWEDFNIGGLEGFYKGDKTKTRQRKSEKQLNTKKEYYIQATCRLLFC